MLQDERFLKIQELNSAEPSKRHSVTYDNVILPQESVEVSPRSSTTVAGRTSDDHGHGRGRGSSGCGR